MIALLSALLGFVSSAVPELFKLFREGRDREHEYALLKLQMEYDRQNAVDANATQLQAIALQADTAEGAQLTARVKESLTGIHWVDALAGSVRPILTYAFFAMYFLAKCAQFHLLIDPALPWQQQLTLVQALSKVWTEEDIAIFSTILAFWFGQRTLAKNRA